MKRLFLIIALLLATPVWAVQPDEVLEDPALEARARALSAGLRCPVCRNENIDDSDSQVSRDLRILLRERLVAGDTDQQAVDYLVARYGEYILLEPTTEGANILLWLAGPIFLIGAAAIGITSVRSRARAKEGPKLTEDEEKRLSEILAQGDD